MARHTKTKLQSELVALSKQRRNYLLAVEVSNDASVCRRRLRSVARLDDEIEARQEALAAIRAADDAIRDLTDLAVATG